MVSGRVKVLLVLMLGIAPVSASAAAPDPGPDSIERSRAAQGDSTGSEPKAQREPMIGLSTYPRVRGTFGGKEPDGRIVNHVVRSHINDFMGCYVERRQDSESPKGEIHVEFTVARSGQVTTSLLRSSTLHVPEIETCVVDAFRKLVFPKPSTDQVIVSYDVMFRPLK